MRLEPEVAKMTEAGVRRDQFVECILRSCVKTFKPTTKSKDGNIDNVFPLLAKVCE
jgi:hypothetical protein